MGQLRYLSAIKHVDLVIGNSSSGLIEVPAFFKPTLNLGLRQSGRLKAASVIDCNEKTDEIVAGIATAISPEFQSHINGSSSPYGIGGASRKVKDYLKAIDLNDVLMKKFHDYPVSL